MPDRTLTHRNRDVNIMWLDQAACQDPSCVGGKVANLSRLAADNSVPPGFCLTTAAFREWANASDDSSEAFPHQLLEQLRSSYAEMGRRTGSETPSVALRSSAIDEDGRFASFTGQYETYLNLVGDDAVAIVDRSFASRRTDRDRLALDRAVHGVPERQRPFRPGGFPAHRRTDPPEEETDVIR